MSVFKTTPYGEYVRQMRPVSKNIWEAWRAFERHDWPSANALAYVALEHMPSQEARDAATAHAPLRMALRKALLPPYSDNARKTTAKLAAATHQPAELHDAGRR
jgi:hypothetical protein